VGVNIRIFSACVALLLGLTLEYQSSLHFGPVAQTLNVLSFVVIFAALTAVVLFSLNRSDELVAGNVVEKPAKGDAPVDLAVPRDVAFDMCLAALNTLGGYSVIVCDPKAGRLEANVDETMSATAQVVSFQLQEQIDGRRVRVHVTSRPLFPDTLTDGGKNTRNVETITAFLTKRAASFSADARPSLRVVRRCGIDSLSIVVLAVLCFGYASYLLYYGMTSATWPHVAGKMTLASVRRVEGRIRELSGHDELVVEYQYSVAGHMYRSDRIQFGGPVTWQGPRAVVNRYRGPGAVVYYEPDKPEVSCIEPGVEWVTTAIMLVLGSFFAWAAWWSTRRTIVLTADRTSGVSSSIML
jgi:hypothetical protein